MIDSIVIPSYYLSEVKHSVSLGGNRISIAIITDSTANISKELIASYNIKIVPLNIHVKDMVLREGIDVSNDEYYDLLRREPIFPKTSQPSSGDFLDVFNSYPPGTEIIVITISSLLSGTYQSAAMAADMLEGDIKVTILDSHTTSVGQGFMVAKACEMAAAFNVLEITAELERIKQNSKLFFVVDNLEYLARGGRISQLSKYIGTILQMKPILHLKHGQIELFEKVRTSGRALKHILGELEKDLAQVQNLAVLHVSAHTEAVLFAEQVKAIYRKEVPIYEANPVIGSHVGPGTVGLAYHM